MVQVKICSSVRLKNWMTFFDCFMFTLSYESVKESLLLNGRTLSEQTRAGQASEGTNERAKEQTNEWTNERANEGLKITEENVLSL